VDRSTHGFRSHFLYPIIIFLGTLCWLVGAALMVSIQPRDGVRIGVENRYTAAGILYVVGASLFLFASIVGLAASYTEARLVRQRLRREGRAREEEGRDRDASASLWPPRECQMPAVPACVVARGHPTRTCPL